MAGVRGPFDGTADRGQSHLGLVASRRDDISTIRSYSSNFRILLSCILALWVDFTTRILVQISYILSHHVIEHVESMRTSHTEPTPAPGRCDRRWGYPVALMVDIGCREWVSAAYNHSGLAVRMTMLSGVW